MLEALEVLALVLRLSSPPVPAVLLLARRPRAAGNPALLRITGIGDGFMGTDFTASGAIVTQVFDGRGNAECSAWHLCRD